MNMNSWRMAAAICLCCRGAAFSADADKRVWDFEGDKPGEIAAGFSEEVGQWRVVETDAGKVLAQQAKNPDETFNVCLVKDGDAKDLGLQVRFKAVAGELDQGGGVVWRAKDAKNYYVARYNPLEDNFRVYKVVAGKRTQLATADIQHGDGWHALRVTMRGEQIRCFYDGKQHLEVRDATFAGSGKVGLWSKADARTYFDELTLLVPSRAPVKFVKPEGLKPLTEIKGDERYKGQDGGLYGGGRNEPPPGRWQAAIEHGKQIAPLDADGKLDNGKPADTGKIALVSIGMSNTTQEFSAFVRMADADPEKSEHVVLVDGAQGGMEAQAWADSAKRDRSSARNPWTVLEERLVQAGVTAPQVQVAWIKQARAGPARLGEFPKHAEELEGRLVTIVQELKTRFPNLRIAYLSSRIYAGYARTPLNPEPYAFESAFAVRWLIRDQMEGKPELNFDPGKGEVKAPLLLWGPYLWADGEQPRAADGLVWKPEDLGPDGTHPSESGRRKVAELLLQFFKTDPTSKFWFRSPN
ncbi:MAG TPA: hypothetical protein VGN42_03815 [Pirellulales bacterium]|nr:hypothetical protein [Pirellulales bacterium]